MKLNKIFERLVTGEFKMHSIGTELVNGSINPEHYGLIVPMLNMGIDALHTRYAIKQEEVIVDLVSYITQYTLHTDHAVYNNTDTTGKKYRYIHDSEFFPFYNTVIKILSIHNEMGQEKFINDENQFYGVHLINHNTFIHPLPDKENALSIVYQSTLPDIEVSQLTDSNGVSLVDKIEIDIPLMFVEPLCYYIGSRVHIGMSSQESMQESGMYSNKYEASLANIKKDQMIRGDIWTSDEFTRQGWV